MKRAWVTVIEWEGRQVGQIERISEVEEWPIYCVNSGWVIPVDFDENGIDLAYLVATKQEDVWTISEHTEQKIKDKELKTRETLFRISELKMEYGNRVLSYFTLPVTGFNILEEEHEEFFSHKDIQKLRNLLLYGFLDDAKALLSTLSPHILPELLTQIMMDRLDEYNKHIQQLQETL